MKKILLIALLLFAFPSKIFALDNIRMNPIDWYVAEMKMDVVVNKDSSLDVTEKIIADCGSLPDKHGIYRVIPNRMQTSQDNFVNTPVKLLEITDFSGKNLKYSTSKDQTNHTITWKIGDAHKTVNGINEYEIKYKIENLIRFDNSNFDELYFNLLGNYWDMEIDKFTASISFPDSVSKNNSSVDYYTGSFGSKNTDQAKYEWSGDKLNFSSNGTLQKNEGITISVQMPKNIFTPYVPSFWEKNGENFAYLIPLLILFLCIFLWKKYGKDPASKKTIVPEFEVPDKLAPIEFGLAHKDGVLMSSSIPAAIIKLAVEGFIKIEKIEKKKLGFIKSDDYKFIKLHDETEKLSEVEIRLMKEIFNGKQEILASVLKKDNFYLAVPKIQTIASEYLVKNNYLYKNSRTLQILFIIFAVLLFVLGVGISSNFIELTVPLIISGLIVIIFSFFMKRRTVKGAEMERRILGFKMYMETAEKYRQQFNEKENIFERFLPYAILFGMTKLWIEKMKEIYSEKYISSYSPIWFYGGSITNFDAHSLNSAISNISSNIASNMVSSPSGSGAGGGGFSGGGGGGGGGGGW
ncbi:MAG: DUF2207 domain-containing protein [Patescibacteria group bacterium]|jgi:uncharacterized membrane protein